jgi:hypothetical protein
MHSPVRDITRGATSWLAVVCVAALLTGCESPVRLMPTPVSFRTGDVDPFAQAGSIVLGTDVPVLYVTNRGAVIEKPEPLYTIAAQRAAAHGRGARAHRRRHARLGDAAPALHQ